MKNNTKTILQCPYCQKEMSSNAALSAHIRAMHPEHWKGSILASVQNSVQVITTNKRGGVKKGSKKKPIKNTCPICGYKNSHPPGMAIHIKGQHPEAWKGNLGESLGKAPSRKWKNNNPKRKKNVHARFVLPERDIDNETRLRKRRLYQKRLRARYYSEGKNSRGEKMPPGWKPRKYRGPRMFNEPVEAQPETTVKETLKEQPMERVFNVFLTALEKYLEITPGEKPPPQIKASKWHIA